MYKPGFVLPSVLLLAAAGCGAAPAHDRASIPQHQWSDADWYAEAIDDAFEAYESELAQAADRRYQSRAEAETLARTLSAEPRFEAHLARALAEHGLTVRGLRVYAERHPDFAARQEAVNVPRMAQARELAGAVASAPVADAPAVEFDAPAEAEGGQLAAR